MSGGARKEARVSPVEMVRRREIVGMRAGAALFSEDTALAGWMVCLG